MRSLLLLALASVALACSPQPHYKKTCGLRKRVHGLSKRDDVDPTTLYPEYNLSVPIDHYHNQSKYEPHSDGYFNLRYWFDDTYYKPGGPVIVLEGGETDGAGRLVYLQKGIVYELAKAVGGMGVILEHRYYGKSFPVPDLSTENMRFCTTDQALVDTAYFAQNVVFAGHEHEDLTSNSVPWIAYGGSYAGAFVAFLRTLYPGVFWGAISSSGVTEAIVDYWQYYEPIREYGPPECISTVQQIIHVVDTILLNHTGTSAVTDLKAAFNLTDLTYDSDFANVVSYNLGSWQGRNWDPEVGDPYFDDFCGNITSPTLTSPADPAQQSTVASLLAVASAPASLSTAMTNFIDWTVSNLVTPYEGEIEEAWDSHNISHYDDRSLETYNTYSWAYQYCTQWGFFQTGSGVPADQLPLISRLITVPFSMLICNLAFNITELPKVDDINSAGGYAINYPRLAIIDGQTDPWRYATPHSPNALIAPENNATDGNGAPWGRKNTIEEPFWLIPDSVHHWDENGLFPNETTATIPPGYINDVHAWEVEFVKAWVEEAKREGYGKHGHGGKGGHGPPNYGGGPPGGWGSGSGSGWGWGWLKRNLNL